MDLRSQIAELEAQETQIESRLNNAQDSEEAARITNELNMVRNRLSEKRYELKQQEEKEQARAEEIEQKVHDEDIPFAMAGIDFTGIPDKVIQLIDAVLRTDRRRLLNEHAIELDLKDNEIEELMAANKSIADEYEKLSVQNNEISASLHNEIMLRLDAEEKRDAAVRDKEENYTVMNAEIQSQKATIDELRAKLEQYEKAAEYQARQDQPISMTAEETNSLQASADAVKKLFARAEDWGSVIKAVKPDGTFERVSRAEFQEEWAPVPPELPSFREEDTASNVEDDSVPDPEAPAAVTEDTFQSDVLAGHSDTDAGETEPATIEERVARLEAAVFGQGKVAA